MADRFGRKGAILLSTLPTFVGWLLIGLATSVEYIYAARFLFGLSIGSAFTVVPMYTGEIAEVRNYIIKTISKSKYVGKTIDYTFFPRIVSVVL